MGANVSPETPMLELTDLHKVFGKTAALRGVSFSVAPGEVHALLGQNGSGKSTLMNIAYGVARPTSGEIRIAGEKVTLHSPRDAKSRGVAMVSQELPDVGSITVAENVLLGSLPTSFGRVKWGDTRARAASILQELSADVDPSAIVRTLDPESRQLVAIAHAIATNARVIIFDESTSSLSAAHAARLFELIDHLKARGLGIVFISQRMSDVRKVADRITVLRDGLVAGTMSASEFDVETATELMTGLVPQPSRENRPEARSETILEASGLTVGNRVNQVSFALRRGEIVGIAGLAGSGHSEVIRALFGADGPPTEGEITFDGATYLSPSPRESIKRGIGMVTGDRRTEGLVMALSALENARLSASYKASLRPLSRRREHAEMQRIFVEQGIRPPEPLRPISQFSGGNQQKVLIARWLQGDLRLLLMDEPTRGIDVGAKAQIYETLFELAASGVSVLVSSTEYSELPMICDRVLVMAHGQIVSELEGADLTETEIVRCAS